MIGLGEKGALLAVRKDNVIERVPAVTTRKVINTIGAGDALFSAFLHSYQRTKNPILPSGLLVSLLHIKSELRARQKVF